MKEMNKARSRLRRAATDTNHDAHGLLVGAGIDQQPQTVRVTMISGTHQRRVSVLRVDLPPHKNRSTQWHKDFKKNSSERM